MALEGRKVGSLKRRVRSQLARWEAKNCTPLWREAHFQVNMYKAHHSRPLLEVEMSKKRTPLWCEAHFQVKSVKKKTAGFRTLFDVKMSFCVGCTRDCELCQNWAKIWRFCSSCHNNHQYNTLHYNTLQYATLHFTTLHHTTLQYTHCTTLHYSTPHHTTLHDTTLHYTTLHYTTLDCMTPTTTATTTTTVQLHHVRLVTVH